MLVMGSMIGSGIFIVSAEIAREVDSPALLIGAWVVAGFMTIVGRERTRLSVDVLAITAWILLGLVVARAAGLLR